ncbi:hypothetical protein [Rubrivirga sp.]|uniref:hypothetical protein n=1 Tax=Rubrivirga sp. TaxID=1885344 RepID=UPI003B5196DC
MCPHPDLSGRRPDFARVDALDRRLARERPVDHARNLRIVEGLRREAVALGVWPPADPLAGIEVDVRLAQAFAALRDVRDAPR